MSEANRAADSKPEGQGQISRREFVKGAAAFGGCLFLTTLLGNPYEAHASDLSGWPERFGMLTDITRCIGCRRCEEACNRENNLPDPAVPFEDKSVFEEKRRTDAQTYTVVNRYADPKTGEPVYTKIQCNHCTEPACASACPVGALKKSPEGPVIYNEAVCIGCRYCMTACPFYIPAFEYHDTTTPAIQKCFMCSERLAEGKVPACATECPVEAITFGKRSDLLKIARERIRAHPEKYIDHIYGEREAGGTDWLYLSGVPFRELGFPEGLGEKPLPELTRGFLSAVPVVLVTWPAVLGGLYLFNRQRRQGSDDKEAGKNEESS